MPTPSKRRPRLQPAQPVAPEPATGSGIGLWIKDHWQVILAVLLALAGGALVLPKLPDVIPSLLVAQPVDKVTYVYERRDGEVPPEVRQGIDVLNRDPVRNIVATTFDKDTVDGNDQVPATYAIALKAALEKGLPELVVESQGKVVRTADVTTKEQVVEASK